MNGSFVQRYGDNIYHRNFETGDWIQEDSFHSQELGRPHKENIQTDTGTTDRVLIGDWFVYWGGEGPMVPEEFGSVVQKTQGHKSIDSVELINSFVSWAKSSDGGAEPAIMGDPFEWPRLRRE